jgi:hypothetical protein
MRSLRFYDEPHSKFMLWLLPDLLNGAFGPNFSEEDKTVCWTVRRHMQKIMRMN